MAAIRHSLSRTIHSHFSLLTRSPHHRSLCSSSSSPPQPNPEPQPDDSTRRPYQNIIVQPVSYPVKPSPSPSPPPPPPIERQEFNKSTPDPHHISSQPVPEPRTWTREDIRYVKDSDTGALSYPARVAPLPEDRVAERNEELQAEVRRNIGAVNRETWSGKANRKGFRVDQAEVKLPFPTLIKRAEKDKTAKVVHDLKEAIQLVKANAKRNFIESLEAHVKMTPELRRTDMKLTGSVSLPHGASKPLRVAVFAEGAKADEARAAGADLVGGEELIEQIKNASSTGQTCLLDNVAPSLLKNLGVKLGFLQAKPLPGAMNFRNFLHSTAPKEFEKESDNGSFEMQRDARHYGTDQNTGSSGMFSNIRALEMERDTRSTQPFQLQRDGRPFEVNPNTEMFRNSSTIGMGLNSSPTERNTRPFGMGWNSSFTENNAGKSEVSRDVRSMNFVKGLIEDNGGDAFGGRQYSRPNFEQNADIVHIKLMRNNSYVTVTDSKGNKKFGASGGLMSTLKGGPKVSRYSAEATAEHVGRLARNMGLRSVVVKLNGFTYFRKKKLAVLSFRDGYTNSRGDQNPIVYIEDTTRRAHNGCRLRKKRRI